jgi:hypothetical protein
MSEDNGYSLIRYNEAPEELKDLVQQKRTEEFQKALTNLVMGTTPPEDFPGGTIPVRPIRGGAKTRYIPGWWFVRQLNSLFGHLWDFDVIAQEIGKEQIWVKGQIRIKSPGKTVREIRTDGTIIETHYDPIEVVKTQFGGSDVKTLRDTGRIMDIADDLKSAATDSMKKCATLLGLASDIYGAKELQDETAATGKQVEILYRLATEVGLDNVDKSNAYSRSKFGKDVKDLEQLEILTIITELRKAKTKGELIVMEEDKDKEST